MQEKMLKSYQKGLHWERMSTLQEVYEKILAMIDRQRRAVMNEACSRRKRPLSNKATACFCATWKDVSKGSILNRSVSQAVKSERRSRKSGLSTWIWRKYQGWASMTLWGARYRPWECTCRTRLAIAFTEYTSWWKSRRTMTMRQWKES